MRSITTRISSSAVSRLLTGSLVDGELLIAINMAASGSVSSVA